MFLGKMAAGSSGERMLIDCARNGGSKTLGAGRTGSELQKVC
jgi:hypothetical protein